MLYQKINNIDTITAGKVFFTNPTDLFGGISVGAIANGNNTDLLGGTGTMLATQIVYKGVWFISFTIMKYLFINFNKNIT